LCHGLRISAAIGTHKLRSIDLHSVRSRFTGIIARYGVAH